MSRKESSEILQDTISENLLNFLQKSQIVQALWSLQSIDLNVIAVTDLGGAVGANCPPFIMKTQLGAPFSARRAPLILTQMHSVFRVLF